MSSNNMLAAYLVKRCKYVQKKECKKLFRLQFLRITPRGGGHLGKMGYGDVQKQQIRKISPSKGVFFEKFRKK